MTIEVGAVPLVEILVRVGVVGIVLVSLHLRLARVCGVLVLRRVILAGVASLAVVALVLRRDVAVSSNHLAIRMLNVPERILNTVQISHRPSRALLH